jgi:hypothetical protein
LNSSSICSWKVVSLKLLGSNATTNFTGYAITVSPGLTGGPGGVEGGGGGCGAGKTTSTVVTESTVMFKGTLIPYVLLITTISNLGGKQLYCGGIVQLLHAIMTQLQVSFTCRRSSAVVSVSTVPYPFLLLTIL